MLNISPVGRNCSVEERNQFEEYDAENHVREKLIQALKKEFPNLALTYSIGIQVYSHLFGYYLKGKIFLSVNRHLL